MTRQDLKQALISIFIGACVAFITTFMEGMLDVLRGAENNAIGGVAATGTYLTNRMRRKF